MKLLKSGLVALVLASALSACADKPSTESTATSAKGSGETAVAIFAGGCFWCMEPPFDKLDGVKSTISGYTGGTRRNPTYKQVSSGRTNHTEAVKVTYDPALVSYQTLLNVFWVNVDPLTKDRQFCDSGAHYRAGIFYMGEEQKALALASKAQVAKEFEVVHTEVTEASRFWPAEDYHQDYYKKNPIRYNYYRNGCRRDARLKQLWGDRAGKSL